MLADGLIVGTREALLFNTSQYFSEFILLRISPPRSGIEGIDARGQASPPPGPPVFGGFASGAERFSPLVGAAFPDHDPYKR